jgi:hypothetical protein
MDADDYALRDAQSAVGPEITRGCVLVFDDAGFVPEKAGHSGPGHAPEFRNFCDRVVTFKRGIR